MANDIKERLMKVRKSLDIQLAMPLSNNTDTVVALSSKEADLLICLIDTVIRWDYEIKDC